MASPYEMPAVVRGFLSSHLMQGIKFHNDCRSFFHIRRIFHFTIRPFCCIISSMGKKKKRRAPHGKADSLSETVEEKAARGKPETPEHLGAAEPRHPPARKPQSLQPQKSTETDGRSPFLCFFFLGKGARLLFLSPHAILVGPGHSGCPRPALPRASPFFFGRRAICYSEKERAPCREDTFKI